MRTAKESKDEKKCGEGEDKGDKDARPGLFMAYNTKLARSSHKPPATRKSEVHRPLSRASTGSTGSTTVVSTGSHAGVGARFELAHAGWMEISAVSILCSPTRPRPRSSISQSLKPSFLAEDPLLKKVHSVLITFWDTNRQN